jgi:hypothetical protein
MATRNGKIANLPSDIREQLNLRLLEGENGGELVAWLNALPAVQSILSSHFNGSPVSQVNLTHWRQGGYLQWLTERECFDSARCLADGDCHVASIGLSAERMLNVLTVRFGQLLMRWDTSPDEGVSREAAFAQMAKKARILQGISRSLLAIHRIQSQSPREKREPASSSAASAAMPKEPAQPNPPARPPAPQLRAVAGENAEPQRLAQSTKSFPPSGLRSSVSARPDPDLSEILEAV